MLEEGESEDGVKVMVPGVCEIVWEVGLKRCWRCKGVKPCQQTSCQVSLLLRSYECLNVAASDSKL